MTQVNPQKKKGNIMYTNVFT